MEYLSKPLKVSVRTFKRYNKTQYFNRLQTALYERQFVIYLQPKVNICSDQIIGAEVLIRWYHPYKGLLSPGTFIPVFESNGFITTLDLFVFEEACRLLSKWQTQGEPLLPLAINVSRIDLKQSFFAPQLITILEKYQLDPSLISIEITETAYVDDYEKIKISADLLRTYGFAIHMDDFGSGYAALSMLQNVTIDTLKIDLSFIASCQSSRRGQNVLSSIVRMAKWLKLGLIVEGVETKMQADFLKVLGCPIAQGYYYSPPLPIACFEELLRTHKPFTRASDNEPRVSLYNEIDLEDLWSPTSAFSLLFSAISEAAGIYECDDNKLELLRGNEHYYKLIDIPQNLQYFAETHIHDFIIEEDRLPFFQSLPSAKTATPTIVSYRRIVASGKIKYLKAKIHFLAGDQQKRLFFILLEENLP
ncbi:MAG TPA: EAL domain-containing protein [Candidatus Avacidaminococcus intestinavium]|uniref:EAL domain-containing protein n=1 Tax=Candidatus Avacidaminococcus intestinavium TaxID=2840684 RepID=A0A9D1MPA2_9FIRM|nr:EAL domain-containing protein [Candidatus Avacidaminococcus intestinavium]